jgi:putative NADH-flavin reductase
VQDNVTDADRPCTQIPPLNLHGKEGVGQYMIQHALDRGYEVVGVCREQSVGKLNAFKGRNAVVPGATNDAEVIKRAVAGCAGSA